MSTRDDDFPDYCGPSDHERLQWRKKHLDAEAEGGEADASIAREVDKLDAGKPRWSLLPWRPLAVVVDVMEYGARKYTPEGWRHVQGGAQRYLDAATRHLAAVHQGELVDPESGLPHLACAACSCLLALAHRMENT